MAISRVSGNILQDDLQRGANLSIQGNLIYFDVTNNRVGVRTSAPEDELTVIGVANASNVRITSATANGVFYAGSTLLALTNTGFTYDGTNVDVTANITAGNIISTGAVIGNVSIGGNLTVANLTVTDYLSGNIIAATGNIIGDNVTSNNSITAATANVIGNVIVGNLLSNASINAIGNITGSNLNITGNAVVGNILTDNYYYANGAPVDFQQPAGANTEIQFNNDYDFGASADLTYDTATGILQVGYGSNGIIETDFVTASSNVVAGNAIIGNNITTDTLDTAGNAIIGGNLIVQGNITYINIEDLQVEDPVIILGTGPNGSPLSINDGKDRGAQLNYYNNILSQQQSAFVGWDNSTGNMIAASNVIVTSDVVTVIDWGTFQAGYILGNDVVANSTITTLGNAVVGNILTDNYYYANGAPVDFQQPAGSNTQIQFNDDYDFGASANLTYDTATGILQVGYSNAGEIRTDVLTVTGNVSSGNISAGNITITANVSSGNLINTGTINSSGNITTPANIQGDYVIANSAIVGNVTITDLSVGNVTANGFANVTGNVIGGNLITIGNADVGGIRTDNYYYANGSPVDFEHPAGSNTQIQFNDDYDFGASANLTYDTATGIMVVGYGNNGEIRTDTVTITGNLSANNASIANALTASTLQTTGNALIGGNLAVNGNITYINVDTLAVEDPIISVGTGANGQPLVLDDGKDRGLAMDYYNTPLNQQQIAFVGYDNSSSGNLILAANVTIANEIVTVIDWGTVQGGNAYFGNALIDGVVTIGTLDIDNLSVPGNIVGGNITSNALITGQDLALSNSATIQANVVVGNLSAGLGTISGGNLTITANIGSGNIINIGTISSTGNITTPANIQSDYVIANSAIIGNVSITDLSVGNISATGFANVTGNVIGGNITSNALITGVTLDLSGNAVVGNLTANADITATENIYSNNTSVSNNIYVGGLVTVLGNITGGNLISNAGIESQTASIVGNITSGNIQTSGEISVVGNVTAGNLVANAGIYGITANLTGNIYTVTDVISNNVIATSNITAVGNIQGGNIISDGAMIGNVDISGNLVVANLQVQDQFFGNTVTISNTVSVVGNTTSGNLVSNALITGANVQISSLTTDRVVYVGANDYLVDSANFTFDGSNANIQGQLVVDNITFDGTAVTSNANITVIADSNIVVRSSNNGNVDILANGTGAVNFSNLSFDGTAITSDAGISVTTSNDGNVVFTPDGTGVVQIISTTALTVPVGTVAQRPAFPDTGALRFNTNTGELEVYDGASWEEVGTDTVAITDQTINGDGSTNTFVLSQNAYANSIIVSTNGVVQKPNVAYIVAGNLITFAEAPAVSDTIDVRFVADLQVVSALTNSSGNNTIQVLSNGIADMSTVQSVQLPTYTVAQATSLPDAADGQIIYVADGDSGSPCLAVYSVDAWKIVALGGNITA